MKNLQGWQMFAGQFTWDGGRNAVTWNRFSPSKQAAVEAFFDIFRREYPEVSEPDFVLSEIA